MTYSTYKTARDAAWKFLIQNHVGSLPVKFSAICRRNQIKLVYDHDKKYLSARERGCTFIENTGKYVIVLNPSDSIPTQRYTIAHEFGHIFLGHFTEKNISPSDMEYQAERFAIDVLAPACVLRGLNLHTAEEIAEICDISLFSAKKRAERMEILYKRDNFMISPLEKQVFRQFSAFISHYRRN